MSQIIKILKDVERTRSDKFSGNGTESKDGTEVVSPQLLFHEMNHHKAGDSFLERKGVNMKKQWLAWGLGIMVIGGVLIAFNYQGGDKAVPLSEIFPDQADRDDADVEYVFMDRVVTPESLSEPSAEIPQSAETLQGEGASKEMEPAAPLVVLTRDVPQTSPAVNVPNATPSAYTIQVASFQQKERAESALKKLTESGHPAFLVSKDLEEKGLWYRIYVGSFQSKDEADRYITRLPDGYKNSFVLHL